MPPDLPHADPSEAELVFKFAILAQMGGPADGPLERVVRWFVRLGIDVASLGMVLQQPLHPSAAFVAFFTLVLFLFGLTLLPDGSGAL